ncbi:uncharacterized protein [Amphiura filiformis]|uniref:uncharacterized protein n=1 Tax=Amphiura filiformis TaxID=82378 RepID=UPI003B226EEF
MTTNIPNPIPVINTEDGNDDTDINDPCGEDNEDDSNTNELRGGGYQTHHLDPHNHNTLWKPKNKISNWVFCLGSTGLFLAFGGAIMTVTGNVEPVLHPMLAYIGPPALVIGVVMLCSSCMYWMYGMCTRWRKDIPIRASDTTASTSGGVSPTGALDTKGQCEILIPTMYSTGSGANENISESQFGSRKDGLNTSTQSLPTQDCDGKREYREGGGVGSSQPLMTKPRSSTMTNPGSVEAILEGYI